ncbi:hypothetical protein [Aureibaculum conchae]|uniref:hypothetical protein n=1 Tax=Aureibaculum sp. 2308TA14-22 TaxID=3108392 RepID=UPI0033944ECA
MKTSALLIILILFNTTALLSEPIAQLVKGIDPLLFVSLEILLIVGYFINKILKDLRKTMDFDCNNLNLLETKFKK